MLKRLLCSIFLITCFLPLFSQSGNIDSLRNAAATQKKDSLHVNTLNNIAFILFKTGKYDSALVQCKEAIDLAEKLHYKKGVLQAIEYTAGIFERQGNYTDGLTYYNRAIDMSRAMKAKTDIADNLSGLGNLYDDQGNYQIALDYYKQSLEIDSAIGDHYGMATNLGDLGNVYDEMGNYPKALECDLRALKYGEELGNKHTLIVNLGNIGNIYFTLGNYAKALENYTRVLAMAEEANDKNDIAVNLGNIGLVYFSQGNYAKALEFDTKALQLDSVIGSKQGIAYNLGNIGDIYLKQLNFAKAIDCDAKALAIARQMNDKFAIGQDFYELGNIYLKQKNAFMAKACLDSALVISKKIGAKENIKYAYIYLTELDSAVGDFKSSLTDYKSYIAYRDSLVNEANTKKTVQAEMNYEFDKKQAVEKLEQDKKDADQKEEQRKQQLTLYFVSGILLLVILFAIFILRSLSVNRKKTKIISKQKEEVEAQKKVVEEQKETVEKQNSLIEQQKAIVEEKNKDITDSIKYASRIQRALFTSNEYISRHLKEYFILLKPRDIVSGDFYWAFQASFESVLLGAQSESAEQYAVDPALIPSLEEKALAFKKRSTEAEKIAWHLLKANSAGFPILRQHVLGQYIVDFINIQTKTVIEIDDGIRNQQSEEEVKRIAWLQQNDFEIIRYKNDEIISGSLKFLDNVIAKLQDRALKVSPGGGNILGAFYMACCDCTGHGVPGAFMSLLNISMLNESVIERNIIRPDRVLNDIRDNIIKSLNPEKVDSESKDGMDCALCAFDFKNNIMQSASANNPVWIIRKDGTFEEIHPDKMPVGIQHGEQKPFTLHNTKLYPGDNVYMFTDGYADQFGGPKGKKFKYKTLQEKLMAIYQLPMAEQRQILDQTLEQWKGNLEQVDDILIMGIRI
jgi:tetratricopeptide (TPR) repeat protein